MGDYAQSVTALFERTANGIKPGLGVISALLAELGNPHQKLAVIHVAGTNGKGSVCSMLESVLRASGFKTGLYTSPHLNDFSERFRINGVHVSDDALAEYIHLLESTADAVEASGARAATFFEISTAIAFKYFADQKVDFAIIETGMGGRWDATNVVIPLVSVITRIDVDHTNFLGDSITQIAGEKAGIIKPRRPAICAPQSDDVLAVLQREAAEKSSPLIISSDAVSVQKTSRSAVDSAGTGQRLKIETQSQNLPPIILPLMGACQRENCAVAVTAIEIVAEMIGFEPAFKKGFESIVWGARFQVIGANPLTILDGAHNPSAAGALVATLKEIYPDHQIGFIVGFLGDKDVSAFLRIVKPLASKMWTVPISQPRGLTAMDVAMQAQSMGLKAESAALPEAFRLARQWAGGEKQLICITGSLYLSSEMRSLLAGF